MQPPFKALLSWMTPRNRVIRQTSLFLPIFISPALASSWCDSPVASFGKVFGVLLQPVHISQEGRCQSDPVPRGSQLLCESREVQI